MCVDAEVETGLCKDVLCISVIGHTTKNCRSPNDYVAVAIAFRHNPCTLSCYLFHHLIWPVQERKLKKHYCPWVIFASLLTKEQNVCAAMNKTGRSLCSHSQSESPQKLFSEADWLVLALLQTPLHCPVIHTVTLKKIMVANVKLLTDVDNDIPIWKHPWNLKDAQDGPVRTNCMRPNFVQTSRTLFFILVEILWCPRISYILGINISLCGHQISEWLAVSVCIYIFII